MLIRNKEYDLTGRTHIMGILNVTPDSFYDGGRFLQLDAAVRQAEAMALQGADFIDIGGESSRPGADPVSADREIARVVPVIEKLVRSVDLPVSVDTVKSETAEAALAAGAAMINDISGFQFDEHMPAVAAAANVPVVLMHTSGRPKVMQDNPLQGDIVGGILQGLTASAEKALSAGIGRDKIILDPGIGFGKKRPDNFLIINNLDRICRAGYPVLVGVSRKSFIGWALDLPEEERLAGTLAANTACIFRGAAILRVHDVKEAVQAAVIADTIIQAKAG